MPPRDLPDFVAEIVLLPTESGGDQALLSKGEWRIVLGVKDEYWSATLDFEGEHLPGAMFEANVWLLLPDVLPDAGLPMFEEGMAFSVWDGETRAHGSVKRVTRRSVSGAGQEGQPDAFGRWHAAIVSVRR